MSGDNHTRITLSNRTIIRVIAFGVATFLAIRFMGSILHPLKLIFIAFFFAISLNPAVSWISGKFKHRSRALATGVAYVIVVTVLISFFALIVPPLVKQGADFVDSVPITLNNVSNQESAVGKLVRKYNLEKQLSNIGSDFKQKFSGKLAVKTASKVGGTIASIITVIILTFMMLVEGPAWLKKFWELQPSSKREYRKTLAKRMYRVITGYVNGQLVIAIIAGFFAFIALSVLSSIFKVDINAVALTGIVVLFALVPMVGGIIGSSLVILVSMFNSLPLALAMLVYFVVYYQIENALVQPYIQSRSNTLTPLLVFMAALIGVGFGGLLGGLVAIPVAGCAKVYVDDRLERHLAFRED